MEVLIVVVILGIVAMVVVPQFTGADEDAKEAALLATIRMLRKQISLYQAQHDGNGPHIGPIDPTIGPWDRLIKRTRADGTIDSAGPYGPYLSGMASNPFVAEAISTSIAVGNGAKPPRNGVTAWYYDVDTCIISANSVTGGESSDPP